jgi:hypothetical protein
LNELGWNWKQLSLSFLIYDIDITCSRISKYIGSLFIELVALDHLPQPKTVKYIPGSILSEIGFGSREEYLHDRINGETDGFYEEVAGFWFQGAGFEAKIRRGFGGKYCNAGLGYLGLFHVL